MAKKNLQAVQEPCVLMCRNWCIPYRPGQHLHLYICIHMCAGRSADSLHVTLCVSVGLSNPLHKEVFLFPLV